MDKAIPVSAWVALRFALVALLSASGLFQPARGAAYIPPREHAIWVFADAASASNPISNTTARQALIDNSAASKVTAIYLGVYRSTKAQPTNAAGRLMYEDADISST